MAFRIQQNQFVQLTRPAQIVDADTNAGALDYDNPVLTISSLRCRFELSEANDAIDAQGNVTIRSGVMYTTDDRIKEKDRILISGVGSFIVDGVRPQYDLRGGLVNHYEISLVEDMKE